MGSLPIVLLCALSSCFVVDKGQGPLSAMLSSVEETAGNRPAVMGLVFLSTMLLTLLSAVPILGTLVGTPLWLLAIARGYVHGTGGGKSNGSQAKGKLIRPSPVPVVSDARVESTLARFETELRDEGKLPA